MTIILLLKNGLHNPHSTGRLMLVAKMKDIGKIMVRVFTKDLRIETQSAGEFIRCTRNNE